MKETERWWAEQLNKKVGIKEYNKKISFQEI